MSEEFIDVLKKYKVTAFEWVRVDDWTYEIRTRGEPPKALVRDLQELLPGMFEVKGAALVEH